MKKLQKILAKKEEDLKVVNRVLFNYRVRKLRYGLNERDRINFVRAKQLQRKIKKEVKGLREKVENG